MNFDPYTRNAVAQENLLVGLGKFLTEFVFTSLSSDQKRSRLKHLLCHDLRILGLGSYTKLNNYVTKSLHSGSMSSVYDLIMLTPLHLKTMK